MATQLRKERNSVSSLKIHLVCVTQYRRHVLTAESLAIIEKSFRDVAQKMNFQIIEFDGEFRPCSRTDRISTQVIGLTDGQFT